MYRFFTDASHIDGGRIRITGPDVNHIRNVLRMKPGEQVLISTGDEWEYTCSIEETDDAEVICRILDSQKSGKELPSKIVLYQCLPKGDKMETVIQKAVELGAARIVPVESKRCVVRLDAKKKAAKVKRWNAVSEAAAKQSKRMIIPEVAEVMTYEEMLRDAAKLDSRFVPYEKSRGMDRTRELFSQIRLGQSIGILIGPEGGFEEKEVERAEAAGFHAVTLGKRILRTETAGMTMLSILMYLLETD
ncbi:MAG: 16S rRNA (uracil(1498)-N(3))-methyltransferase [Eubacterium sp.]|nr:16S rRNA (uracil(1498)-N(3))-methyltransferase [Eubacterium sp.]